MKVSGVAVKDECFVSYCSLWKRYLKGIWKQQKRSIDRRLLIVHDSQWREFEIGSNAIVSLQFVSTLILTFFYFDFSFPTKPIMNPFFLFLFLLSVLYANLLFIHYLQIWAVHTLFTDLVILHIPISSHVLHQYRVVQGLPCWKYPLLNHILSSKWSKINIFSQLFFFLITSE